VIYNISEEVEKSSKIVKLKESSSLEKSNSHICIFLLSFVYDIKIDG